MNIKKDKIQIAVLITCHNRKIKTLSCLEALFHATLPSNADIAVFLVDDGSTDGTSESVKSNFPQVKIITGNGSLFWNLGMHLAWESASNYYDYDFYLLLNDDTILYKSAIVELYNSFEFLLRKDKRPSIIVGACESVQGSSVFSYGGWVGVSPVVPNGELQTCQLINGNATLVPKKIYHRIGNLSTEYTHSIGDSDYGLSAISEGFKCYTTKGFIGECPRHDILPDWCNPEKTLRLRWKNLHSPKGLNIKEYIVFRKKFWGWRWIVFALKAYLKTLMPKIYNKLLSKGRNPI